MTNYQCWTHTLLNLQQILQVKLWVKLNTTVTASKPVLAMKNILFERAGVPSFPSDLAQSGYEVIFRNNAR